MCGENIIALNQLSGYHLSPPRVRGKQDTIYTVAGKTRITPACAGKTEALEWFKAGSQDHPRVCGENHIAAHPLKIIVGSPPRVRGKHEMLVLTMPAARITPACAGKT